jgi:hypothetical protein
MRYQYYSEISEKHGLIILDDRTVLHKNGNLLVQGKRWGRPRQVGSPPPPEPSSGLKEPELITAEPSNTSHLPVPRS